MFPKLSLKMKINSHFSFFGKKSLAVEFCNNAVQIPEKFLSCTLLRMISIHKVLPSEQEELAKMAKNPQSGSGKNYCFPLIFMISNMAFRFSTLIIIYFFKCPCIFAT